MSKGKKINSVVAIKSCFGLFEQLDILYPRKWDIAGSLRRALPKVGDVDIVICGKPAKLWKVIKFHGDAKASFMYNGVPINIVFTNRESYGAALLYLTGSKNFNIIMRSKAKKKGGLLNEYGLYDGSRKIAGKTEEEIFKELDMEFVEPEDREK